MPLQGGGKKGEFIRFCINGCLAVAIQYAVYWVLIRWMNPNLSYTISYLVSFCCKLRHNKLLDVPQPPVMEEADRLRRVAHCELLRAVRFPEPLPLGRHSEGVCGTARHGLCRPREAS